MTKTISQLVATATHSADDYTENGLLMCGNCHTPKQCLQEFPTPNGGTQTTLVPTLCECQLKKRDADKEQAVQERFQANIDRLRASDGISDPAYLKTTFEKDDRHNAAVSDLCRRYIDQWERVCAENIGILFYGSVGTGKSFYACAVANALVRRQVTATVTNFPRLLNLLQSCKDRQGCIDSLQAYWLLVIDDLGIERDSAYAMEQVYGVIDARARSGLPLIVTTNLTLEELQTPPTMAHARIYDRVLELCPIRQRMTGESRRVKNAEVRKQIAREILSAQKICVEKS